MNEKSTNNRFSISTGIVISVVAVIVSGIQVYAAIQNNRLVEAQTIGGFIPHLMKNETRTVALVAMNRYVDRGVVIEMASLLKSEVALEELSKKGTTVEKDTTIQALNGLNKERSALIEKMFSNNKSERITATTSLFRDWSHTGQLLEEALTRAEKTPNQKSGVINTLVLFSSFDPLILISYEENLEKFFGKIDKNGPQTRSNIDKLRELIKSNKETQSTSESGG